MAEEVQAGDGFNIHLLGERLNELFSQHGVIASVVCTAIKPKSEARDGESVIVGYTGYPNVIPPPMKESLEEVSKKLKELFLEWVREHKETIRNVPNP